MDISTFDSDYHSEPPLTMSECLTRHRRPPLDYSTEASDDDSGFSCPTACAVSAPPARQALTCGEDTMVWNLFCKLVLDGKKMPASVFETNSEEFHREFIDSLYKKAEATVKRESQPRRS